MSLLTNQGLKVKLSGHAWESGSAAENKDLSELAPVPWQTISSAKASPKTRIVESLWQDPHPGSPNRTFRPRQEPQGGIVLQL